MPINEQGLFTFRDDDYIVDQVLTSANLNRLRADVKEAFDMKMQRPAKPWVKGNLLWYNGADWVVLAPGSTNQVLKYGASDTPAWSTIAVQGNAFTFEGDEVTGDILWYNGTNWVLLNRGSANQVLSLDSDRDPYWRNITQGFNYTGTPARGDILYYGSANQWRLLTAGSSGQILEQGTNDPQWVNKPTGGSTIAFHEASGTYGSNNWVNDIANSAWDSISGTNAQPFDDKAEYFHIGTLSFTPSSTSSKIYVHAIVVWSHRDSNTSPGGQYGLFFILDNGTVNHSNIVGNNIGINDTFTLSRNIPYSQYLTYDYTITSSTEKTIKLYLGGNNQSGLFRVHNWYIEAMEVY